MAQTRPMTMDANKVRQRNLSAVLGLVHRQRGITRADLTRTLGLNRSTVGDLVGALAEAGWVEERDDAPRSGVGRPSPRVLPTDDRLVVAVNPELDAVEIGLVALGGRVVARRRMAIDAPTVDQAVRVAALAAAELAQEHPSARLVGAGIAVPGLVRREDGVVRLAPHLGWSQEPIAAPLASALALPARAANDAQLGAQAELAFGAALGARSMVYLNGGASGIGGAIVADGLVITGRDGHAGELGHLGIEPDGPTCACGARGCLEAVVARRHMVDALHLEHPADDDLAAALAASSDPAVATIVSQHWRGLRVGLRNIVTMLNPELIVLGGYLATLWSAVAPADRESVLAHALPAIAENVRIEVAGLGENRLLIGAAELAWEPLLADPLAT